MSDQSRPAYRRPYAYESTPAASRQIVKFLTAGATSASLLVLFGLTLTGTTIALVISTPLLVIFSPVVVPAGIALFLIFSGFFLSGVFGVSGITALTWLYKYVMRGEHRPGADQLDYAEGMLAKTAKDMKERAKEYGQYVQQKAPEAT